MHFWHKGDSV